MSASEDRLLYHKALQVHPNVSHRKVKACYETRGSEATQKTINYTVTVLDFNPISLWPSIIKQMDWTRCYYGNITS